MLRIKSEDSKQTFVLKMHFNDTIADLRAALARARGSAAQSADYEIRTAFPPTTFSDLTQVRFFVGKFPLCGLFKSMPVRARGGWQRGGRADCDDDVLSPLVFCTPRRRCSRQGSFPTRRCCSFQRRALRRRVPPRRLRSRVAGLEALDPLWRCCCPSETASQRPGPIGRSHCVARWLALPSSPPTIC